ncbi:MAG TPA: exodeoxyribonuclease III, partial [Candidatus Saccharimonadales bacterium]|nr:exodeoxyribonuclease III [Candidatus Saccharimonadales bacterium]
RDLSRLSYKLEFNKDFLEFIKKLKKPAIISGDFNVAHTEQDIARAKQNEENAGYTKQERDFFSKLLNAGFVDTFRSLNPNTIKYSWWLQIFSARQRNIGWRIDYNVIDKALVHKLKSADILIDIYGSDHCPVVMELN